MDMPETTEEFYGYLKSVKETDVMGNGQGDEIPFSAMDIDHLFHYLKGSFGIGNRGNSNEYIDIDPETGEVRFSRKSTRLNSSHVAISYAVFCLKKKKIDVMIVV